MAPAALAETRLALVIAQENYSGNLGQLDQAPQEAKLVAAALKETGFAVQQHADLKKPELEAALSAFRDKLKAAGPDAIGFVYYTGHGASDPSQAGSDSFLLGTEARVSTHEDLRTYGIELDAQRDAFDKLDAKAVFLVFDACRDGSGLSEALEDKGIIRVEAGEASPAGFTIVNASGDMLIAYAAAIGKTAKQGVYAPVLADALRLPYQSAATAFDTVQRRVAIGTDYGQKPWSNNQIYRQEICFAACPPEALLAKGQEAGLKEAQARAILASFGWENIPADQWGDRLAESASKLRELEARLAAADTGEAEIDALMQKARIAIEAADFTEADRLLSDAESIGIAAGERTLRLAISAIEQRAELAQAEGRYEVAADHYARAADQVPRTDGLEWARLKFEEGTSAYDGGKYNAELILLRRAVTSYDEALKEFTRELKPAYWEATQQRRGDALLMLGRRGDDAALADAITAYREQLNRARLPRGRAYKQDNLGTALLVLGRRGDDAALTEAITLFREALKVYTREGLTLKRKSTQFALGNALWVLGGRGDDAALAEAITIFREQLKERTRELDPLGWAMRQNLLGKALETKGDRTRSLADWEAAGECYRNALLVWTEAQTPADWRMATDSLERVSRTIAGATENAGAN